ncbi:MAG: hypothetical protein DRI48_01480 [Chloroflexi bacterium]|nr:MAG: hypothetical protein DRI48_01480 [Chloroflexota bacterium]
MNAWVRLRFAVLILADRLLGTHLVDRELARLQQHIEIFEKQASTIRKQMGELNRLLHLIQVQMCVLYLHQRYLLRPESWLCFAPAESTAEEKELELLIGRLVKHDLAKIRTESLGDQRYVYYLRPDWDALVNLLNTGEPQYLDPVVTSWLDEMRSSE